MHRRSFFQQFLVIIGLSPWADGIAAVDGSIPDPCEVPPSGRIPSPQTWLEEWRRLPQQPLVREHDWQDCPDARVREMASRIHAGMGAGERLCFRYFGGSEPGALRSVLPVLLFRKFETDEVEGVVAPGPDAPIYLLAYCRTRGAARIFRVDRMEAMLETELSLG